MRALMHTIVLAIATRSVQGLRMGALGGMQHPVSAGASQRSAAPLMETMAEKKARLQAKRAAAAAVAAEGDAAAAAEKALKDEAQKKVTFTDTVFFDISIDGASAGRITMGLYGKVVPKTARSFKALCTGDNDKSLTFRGSPFHRIVPKFVCQGGDITSGNGKGGESIYGATFADENFEFSHIEPGLLSMANKGPDTNNSGFSIMLDAADYLDGKHVVFGKVTDGLDIVKQMEAMGTKKTGVVTGTVEIMDCGAL